MRTFHIGGAASGSAEDDSVTTLRGGNIVFEDSHADAVREGVRNLMSNSGQSCDAPTRMLVEKSIYKRAIEEAADEANKIKVDLASKKGDHIGPVVSKKQIETICSKLS